MGETEGDILYLEQDNREGILWMTTRSSLIAMRYDEARRCLRQTDFRLPAEYGNMLNEIYQDKDGNLWVASFDGKSFIIHFTENAPEEFSLPALSRPSWPSAMQEKARCGYHRNEQDSGCTTCPTIQSVSTTTSPR